MRGFYHITKISCEKIIERYSKLFPITTTSMRIPAIYGPMERPTKSRINMSPVFKLLKLVLTDRKKTIRIKGLDYASDWTYVMDAVKGLVSGLDAPEPLSPVYNIASGVKFSLREFLSALKDASNVEFNWVEVSEEKDADFIAPIS
jgi:nucleoside-diphosphate-sugar epimerase